MKLDGRRQSNNIEDRRSSSTGRRIGIGGGITGAIIVAVVTLLSGGDLGDVMRNVMSSGEGYDSSTDQTEYVEDEEDARLAKLSSQILAGTEDVWTREFERQGWGEYTPPKMVLYHGSIQTGCGQGTAQVGPFYCSADQTVYLDLDFFKTMQTDIGASGDFCYAYVIAHEVGHHVQYLLGTLDEAHQSMSKLPEAQANQISVKLELQADYYAGVWGYNDNEMFGSIEPGDVDAAINAASKIGDDYLQRKAYGYEVPESFNHGRSEWRVRWLERGLECGSPTKYNPFSVSYDQL